MSIVNLFQDIRYVGEAEGDRKTYHVFETRHKYLVFGRAREGYYMNVVDREIPKAVTKAFKGQQVTSRLVKSRARRPDLFDSPLAALNVLYVMVSLGHARKLKRRQGRAIVFKIK